MSFSVGLVALNLAICLGDSSGCVEARGVGGRHGGASVVMGGRSSMGDSIQRLGAIQRLEVGGYVFSG